MHSLSRKKKIQHTEILIRESLLRQLSYSIKEVQLLFSKKNEVFSTDEATSSLIVVLEAIFLHGLKRGLLKSAFQTVAGENNKPQPSFWNMVCSYTHKDTLSSIRKLSQINTDVGRCRVWIRLALSEAELTSYFTAMEKDRRVLNSFYSSHAFLRDRETCDTACRFLEGIVSVQFKIPINSSILNTWNTEPLMLSGVWSPAMKTPLSTAVDVAEKIEDEDDDTCSIKTSSSITALSTILALDEAEALKMILEAPIKKPTEELPLLNSIQDNSKPEDENFILEKEEENLEIKENYEEIKYIETKQSGKGNSLANAYGWPSTDDQHILESNTEIDKDQKVEDYSILLEKVGISPSKQVNYEDILKEIVENQSDQEVRDPPFNESSNGYNSFASKIYKIVRETGLKGQRYTCANCQVSIGLCFGEARLCYFTGEYFCDSCHVNETSIIPSRLIFNWDHKKYPVCLKANKYLNDICNRFLIDIKNVNPKLYSAVKEMKEMRAIRIQLNMLKTYLYTCKESLFVDLQKKLTTREYIYEFIDHYSINDLCQVPGGVLAAELNAIVSFGRNHVINCCLCSQKGFVCEICKNPNIIHFFDISSTYRCNKCFSMYHNTCLHSIKNCPKCKRLKNKTLSQGELNANSE